MTSEPTPALGGPARTPVAIGTTMLGLGDSIAAGIGAPHVSEGYLPVLGLRLAALAPRLAVVNLAVPGETSSSMLNPGGQLDRAETLVAEVGRAGGRVAPITVSIGGNDVMEAAALGDEMAMSLLARNLDAILRRLDAALRGIGSQLSGTACLQTVYNPFELVGADGEPLPAVDADAMAPRRSTRGGHNRIIRAAAAHWGVDLADVARIFRGRVRELTWVRSGDIHPSAHGHAVIADAYVAACGWDGV
jgi:lysophospholipase L1-like esterase